MTEKDFRTLAIGSKTGDKTIEACPKCGNNGYWNGEPLVSDFIHSYGQQPSKDAYTGISSFTLGWLFCSPPFPQPEKK